MSVRIEQDGPVYTVALSRPEVRNAVDAETAVALAGAFSGETVDGASRFASGEGRHGVFDRRSE